jgi:low affinity Fe/Cu permease
MKSHNLGMKKKEEKEADHSASRQRFVEHFASIVTKATGSNAAFIIALSAVLLWLMSGPVFHFSEKWQLVINTITSVTTFLMVFLIQKSQNKDSLAIQLKLNELVAAHEYASNRLVSVENMTEDELKIIQKYYHKLGEFAKKEDTLQRPHSIDEAHHLHQIKKEMERELEEKQKK